MKHFTHENKSKSCLESVIETNNADDTFRKVLITTESSKDFSLIPGETNYTVAIFVLELVGPINDKNGHTKARSPNNTLSSSSDSQGALQGWRPDASSKWKTRARFNNIPARTLASIALPGPARPSQPQLPCCCRCPITADHGWPVLVSLLLRAGQCKLRRPGQNHSVVHHDILPCPEAPSPPWA